MKVSRLLKPVARRGWYRDQEVVLVGLILAMCLAVGTITPAFWSVSTGFDVVRESLVEVLFALGVLLVMVSGGIDVSFMAVGIFAGYTTVRLMPGHGSMWSVLLAFALSILIGVGLGMVNAAVVVGARIPTLIATLGTQTIFSGVLLTFVGTRHIGSLPGGLSSFANSYLVVVRTSGGTLARLHWLVIPTVLICWLFSWFLRRTLLGRGVYAVGGDAESARRVGFPVIRARVVVFCAAGAVAGFAGLSWITLTGQADPFDLVGTELDVLAAVVIGGALITGGRGTVRGTMLGVALISLMKNSLILIGVSGGWERAAVGLLLLGGVAIQSMTTRQHTRRPILDQDASAAQLPADLVEHPSAMESA